MSKIDELVTPAVKNLVTLCRKYCTCLEMLKHEERNAFFDEMLVMLPGIYRGVMRLPQTDKRYAYEPEKFVTERVYRQMRKRLQDELGAQDRFPLLADPTMPERMRLSELSLAEILCDVYQEVKDFVSLYERGSLEDMNDAVKECQTNFKDRLGAQLLSAAYMMHLYRYQPLPDMAHADPDEDLYGEEMVGPEEGFQPEEFAGADDFAPSADD